MLTLYKCDVTCNMIENFFTLEGNVDDLLMSNTDNSIMATRLVMLDSCASPEDEEIVDVSIMSSNKYGWHPFFDKLLGKRIRVSVDIL